ncbi:hypothetical protein QAD02_013718 [Eretmocerus hayati]|uniref:Uncharacterized protein n=1 Tax=Eretmocerus hayati TaxID=131215 RepID=A0ACC2P3B6_9HYME|nr:hypothetical protein QAD02_013718 [Eretmocerus hayati]
MSCDTGGNSAAEFIEKIVQCISSIESSRNIADYIEILSKSSRILEDWQELTKKFYNVKDPRTIEKDSKKLSIRFQRSLEDIRRRVRRQSPRVQQNDRMQKCSLSSEDAQVKEEDGVSFKMKQNVSGGRANDPSNRENDIMSIENLVVSTSDGDLSTSLQSTVDLQSSTNYSASPTPITIFSSFSSFDSSPICIPLGEKVCNVSKTVPSSYTVAVTKSSEEESYASVDQEPKFLNHLNDAMSPERTIVDPESLVTQSGISTTQNSSSIHVTSPHNLLPDTASATPLTAAPTPANRPCNSLHLGPSYTVISTRPDPRFWGSWQTATSTIVPISATNFQPPTGLQHVRTISVPAIGLNYRLSTGPKAAGSMVAPAKYSGYLIPGGLHSAASAANPASRGVSSSKVPQAPASSNTSHTTVPLAAKLARLCSKRQSATFATYASNTNTLNDSRGSPPSSGTSSTGQCQRQKSQNDQPCKCIHCKGPVAESFGYFPGYLNNISEPPSDAALRVASLLDAAPNIVGATASADGHTLPQDPGSRQDMPESANKPRQRTNKVARVRQGRESDQSKLQRCRKFGSTGGKKKPRMPMQHDGFIYAYERTSGNGTE